MAFPLVFPFLLVLAGTCLAAKNALLGQDVLMLSGNDTPAMMLVDENLKPIGDLGGTDLTYCMNVFLKNHNGQNNYMFHSYASEEGAMNEVYMYISHEAKSSSVCIKRERIEFANAIPELDKWTHTCFSWTSSTGTINLYYNGVKVGTKSGVKKGKTVGGKGVLVLGQDQDKLGGDFEAEEGMYGRMTQLNAWRRVLTDEEVKKVQEGKVCGDLIDWRNSLWSLSGNALVVESDAPNAAPQKPVCTVEESLVPTDLSICLRFNGDSWNQGESFVLFYYKTRSGTSQMSLTINDDKTTSITMGTETRKIPHLTVTPGWHHWCFVWSEETLKVFIDGAMFDSLSEFSDGTILATDGDLYIHEINSRNRVISNVTGFVVWERALSKKEVSEDFVSRGKQPGLSVKKVSYASASAYIGAQQFPYPFTGYQRPILLWQFPIQY